MTISINRRYKDSFGKLQKKYGYAREKLKQVRTLLRQVARNHQYEETALRAARLRCQGLGTRTKGSIYTSEGGIRSPFLSFPRLLSIRFRISVSFHSEVLHVVAQDLGKRNPKLGPAPVYYWMRRQRGALVARDQSGGF